MKRVLLVWKAWNKEHIQKHSITVKEVEEAYTLSQVISKGKRGRIFVNQKYGKGE